MKKAKQFVYPSEFLAFVWCTGVPAKWRRNVAIAVYLGLRDGEQRALRWEHVDLEHGTVNVCETTTERKARARGDQVGAAPRTVPIHPSPSALVRRDARGIRRRGARLSRASTANAPGDRGLRTWLRKAERHSRVPSSIGSTGVNLSLRWHDLTRDVRHTWLAVEWPERDREIRDVLGHTQVSMTDRYMRDASAVSRRTVPDSSRFPEPLPDHSSFKRHDEKRGR